MKTSTDDEKLMVVLKQYKNELIRKITENPNVTVTLKIIGRQGKIVGKQLSILEKNIKV